MTTRSLLLRNAKISQQLRQLNILKDEASLIDVTLSNGREHHVLDTDIVSLQSIEANWDDLPHGGTVKWFDTSGTAYAYTQQEFTEFVDEVVLLRAESATAAINKYTDTVPLLPLPDDDPVFSLEDWYT